MWLNEALDNHIRPHFKDAGYTIPAHVRISTGWPSKGGLAVKRRTIGQAWHEDSSKDGTREIIISLYLDDPIEVLATLEHECIHVTVGNEVGHGKPFVDCMKAIGLEGKPTSTHAGDELKKLYREWIKSLGLYPHAAVDASKAPKQGTRLLKLECGCGCKARVTQTWIDTYGEEWPCPCGGSMIYDPNP